MQFDNTIFLESFLKRTSDIDRRAWIITTLNLFGIPYKTQKSEIYPDCVNIFCEGKGNIWFSAHYDTVDIRYCANDNSASIINLIDIKFQNPNANVVFLDMEESPYLGEGSRCFSKLLKEIDSKAQIINLELTGYGNQIVLGKQKNILQSFVSSLMEVEYLDVPFNDADVFEKNGFSSLLLTLLPKKESKLLLESIYHCHTKKDSLEKINYEDMSFLVTTLLKIIKE